MKNLIRYFLIITSLSASNSFAQDSTANNFEVGNSNAWIKAGVGNSYFGPTFKTNLSYSFKKSIFTLRYISAKEFHLFGGGDPPIQVKEIGALYGISFRKYTLVFTLSGGVAYINGILRGNPIDYRKSESIKVSTISIPLEVNFRIEFCKYVGMGGTLFGNINSKQTFGGWAIEFYIGKLR